MEIEKTCFTTFPVLHTPRLTLRKILLEDAERIFEMRANWRNNQFMLRPDMQDYAKAEDLVKAVDDGYNDQKMMAWAGLLRDEKTIVGTCGFNRIDHQNLRAEIGGELYIEYWGKHIALEAVQAIIDYGFNGMKLHSIEAKINPGNRGAIHLVEQLGFLREAYFKEYGYYEGSFHDLAIYSKLNPKQQ